MDGQESHDPVAGHLREIDQSCQRLEQLAALEAALSEVTPDFTTVGTYDGDPTEAASVASQCLNQATALATARQQTDKALRQAQADLARLETQRAQRLRMVFVGAGIVVAILVLLMVT